MLNKLKILLIFIAAACFTYNQTREVKLGSGIFAPESPKQALIENPESFVIKKQRVTPLADFEITAKVLSKRSYYFGRETNLSPIDFALGWGRMSDEDVIKSISFSQSRRWLHWRSEKYPIPQKEVNDHCANMHILPSSRKIKRAIKRARVGDIIYIKGYLVKVAGSNGSEWKSSLSRTDSGDHACEVIWVKQFEILKEIHPVLSSSSGLSP